MAEDKRTKAYGSPMTKLSPALMDGTSPKEPTRAAAPSLSFVSSCIRRLIVEETYEMISP